MALLVKPILLFWPIVSVVVYYLFAGLQDGVEGELQGGLRSWLGALTGRWKHALLIFLIPLFCITSWAGLNYWRNGVFTISTIGTMDARVYLAAQIEEQEVGGNTDGLRERQRALRKRFDAIPAEERMRTYKNEYMAIFEKYPLRTAKQIVHNAWSNYVAGWDSFPSQLPYSQEKLRQSLRNISMWETRMRKVAVLPLILSSLIAFIAVKVRPSQQDRRLVPILFAMTLTFLYFVVCSAITFWGGSRILFPTEILIISTVATLLDLLVRTIGHPRGPGKPPPKTGRNSGHRPAKMVL